VLRQDGSVTLVQCGHWREQRVGAEPVRALYKVMTAERATDALIVTAGSFTAEAMALAQRKPIGLIEGVALLDLLQSVQAAQPKSSNPRPSANLPRLLAPHGRARGAQSVRQGRSVLGVLGVSAPQGDEVGEGGVAYVSGPTRG